MHKTLFISKNSGEIKALQRFADEHALSIFAHSFLVFHPVDFSLPDSYDVIFFGSPRAVMFFQARKRISEETEIACVGGKTAALLKSLGYSVAFNGEEKGSITEVAAAFKEWLGDRIALFPISTRSLGTIFNEISPRQVKKITCYDTRVEIKKLDRDFDVYVFTSPSNVEGFLKGNTFPKTSKVIAWGESTAAALRTHGILPSTILAHPNQEALILELTSDFQ